MRRRWLAAAFSALVASGAAGAQSTAAATETAPAKPAAAASVVDALTLVLSSDGLQRSALADLRDIGAWRDLARRAAALEAEVDALAASAAARAELSDPLDQDRLLRTFEGSAKAIVDALASTARRLEHDRNALDADANAWQARLALLNAQLVPAPVLERARSIEAKLRGTSSQVRESRDDVLLALDRALALQVRIDEARAVVAAQQDRVRSQKLRLQESPLWRLGAPPAQFETVGVQLRTAWHLLRDYLVREGAGIAGVFFGVVALTGWLFARRPGEGGRPELRAYGRPVAAALLIALMSLWWLAPDPPVMFYEALLVLVPIPAAMVAQRALPANVPLTLYGLAGATMLLVLRRVIEASAIADRLMLLVQVMIIAVPVAVDLHRGRLQQAFRPASPGTVRATALLVIAVALFTLFEVLFGFKGPTRLLRSGVGSILGFGLVFGATAVALYGAVLALLSSPLAGWLRSAHSADPALLRTVRRLLAVLTVAGVVIMTLGGLGLVPALRAAIGSLLGATLEVGTVSIAANGVAMALAVVLATFILAGLAGYILDREIVPRLRLRPGAGYAIITFTRWTIVIVGTVLTFAALGIDMAKVTLVASAIGVGIGFGLQNVVNNFISGLILIVERPVGIGDLIEVGPLLGEVKHIGIRSSIVRTTQGAEVVVPNGELVSKEVVNWTRSDRQRRYEIDVGVAYGTDPDVVLRLLVQAAAEVPEVMSAPAPFAMFRGFGDSSLDFRLLAWVQSIDVGLQAQSGLRVAILRKLADAGIDIPFPQRDLHIRTGDAGAPSP